MTQPPRVMSRSEGFGEIIQEVTQPLRTRGTIHVPRPSTVGCPRRPARKAAHDTSQRRALGLLSITGKMFICGEALMSDARMHRLFNRARIDDRQVNELIGLAHGIVADGVVTQTEAEFVQKWLVANTAVSDNPVVGTLLTRVNEMLADRCLGTDESHELLETLRNFSAGDFQLGEILKATRLPIDNPQPELEFEGSRFCFTGTFAFGSRRHCEEAVVARGGEVGSLVQLTRYLVIGVYATESWAHSSFGRKIERAVDWREHGLPISIVSEEHWVAAL